MSLTNVQMKWLADIWTTEEAGLTRDKESINQDHVEVLKNGLSMQGL